MLHQSSTVIISAGSCWLFLLLGWAGQLMIAVIGKACHAAALVVHLCSCVVVGLDDQAYVPACECHIFSHTEQ